MVARVLVFLLASTTASIFKGKTDAIRGQGSGTEFAFLGKFCFDGGGRAMQGGGMISGWVSTPQFGVRLALYDDRGNEWQHIHRNTSCPCQCKLQRPQHARRVEAVTPVELDHSVPMPFHFSVPASDQPRFWYVVLAKCHSLPVGVYADYMLEAVQADGSQIPTNERGLRELYAAASALWLGLVVVQVVAATRMLRAGVFHPLAKLLASSVVMYFLRNVFMFLHWTALARNGRGDPLLEALAHVSSAFVRVFMLMLLMLIAKGWTISTTQIPQNKTLILGMMCMLTNYMALFLWDLFNRDPASSMYLYDSWPGLGIAFTHVVFLAWFSSTIRATLALEHSVVRRKFFFEVWATYTFYLLILPFAVLLATFLPPWMRQKVVEYVLELCNTGTYFHIVYLLWPSRAPTYFQRLYTTGAASEAFEERQMLAGGAGLSSGLDGFDGGIGGGMESFQTGQAQFDEL